MNADETVRGLRYTQNKYENKVILTGETDVSAMCRDSADLIESLQADLRHEEKVSHGQMEQNKRLRKMMDKLQAQLAESQRREQAAVKQIEQKMIFDAGMGREPCEICANAEKTPCIHCEPKWRGPQEAGKGDNDA